MSDCRNGGRDVPCGVIRMSKTEEPRPCPECGGNVVIDCINNDDYPNKMFVVECYACRKKHHVFADDEEGAVRAWNAMGA